MDGLTTMTVET